MLSPAGDSQFAQTVFSIGYDFHFGTGNNGNVFGITNYKDQNRNQTFTYGRKTIRQGPRTESHRLEINPSYGATCILLAKSVELLHRS